MIALFNLFLFYPKAPLLCKAQSRQAKPTVHRPHRSIILCCKSLHAGADIPLANLGARSGKIYRPDSIHHALSPVCFKVPQGALYCHDIRIQCRITRIRPPKRTAEPRVCTKGLCGIISYKVLFHVPSPSCGRATNCSTVLLATSRRPRRSVYQNAKRGELSSIAP